MPSERLAVLLSGELIGHLERASEADDPTFAYTPEYVREGEVALSARLPIQAEAHPARYVMPYLFGILPESVDALTAWADQLGVDVGDAFGILAAMGWDCPGAVQFAPEAEVDDLRDRSSEYQPVDEAAIAERIRTLTAGVEPSWTMPGEHWSLGGQQEKFALARLDGAWFSAHGSAATTHIVKPGILALHHQALAEHVTMAAAARLGVEVAGSSFERFEDQWAIVVERFDRATDGDRVTRLHQEDFAQAVGRMPARKYESRGGPTLRDMMRVLGRESSALDDRLALADFLVVNLVAGAPDGHAKNVSLLRMPRETRVAPLYDLATGLAYDAKDIERKVALSIGGEREPSRIRRTQWEKAARILELDIDLLLGRVAMLATGFPQAFEAELDRLSDAPGATGLAERGLPALEAHARGILDRLGS